MVKGYRQRVGQPPVPEYRATINGMPKDMREPDIVKIVNDGVVPRLDDLDLARDYNANKLQKHFRTNTEVPFSYIKDIDFTTMAKFSEHDVGLPGVDIAIKPVRSYVYGALAAHLLGYVGAPDDTNKEEARKFTFYQGDVEGKSAAGGCECRAHARCEIAVASGRGAAHRGTRRGRGGGPEQRKYPGDGFGTLVRSKHIHPQHQGEGLGNTAGE